MLGSGAGREWLSRGVAVNNYFNLFIIWKVLAKLQSVCWKSVESVKELDCFRDPQGAHLQSWRWPFSLDICDLWAMAAHESKLNTSNRRHFHLRKMRCRPCFRNSAARSKQECFSLEMIRCVCLSGTAGFYNNVALWLFQIVAHKQHTKRLQGSANKEASTTACILKQKVNIPAWWHHASGRTTFC